MTGPEDLKRDLLKSEYATVMIPELELELTEGTLGGKYTTLEGLLEDIKYQLLETNAFKMGDATTEDDQKVISAWIEKLEKVFNILF